MQDDIDYHKHIEYKALVEFIYGNLSYMFSFILSCMIIIRMQTYGLFFIFRLMQAGNVTGGMSGAETTAENLP